MDIKKPEALHGGVIDNFFPISSGRYWFITTYAVLIILSPFLSLGLRSLFENKENILPIRENIPCQPQNPYEIQYRKNTCKIFKGYLELLLYGIKAVFSLRWLFNYDEDYLKKKGFVRGLSLIVVFTILYSVLPYTLLKRSWPAFYPSNVLWFTVLYCWAAFMSYFNVRLNVKKAFFVFIFCLGTMLGSIYYLDWTVLTGENTKIDWLFISNMNSIFILLLSIVIFLFFKDYPFKFNKFTEKFIAFFASSTLAVYLIHDNRYVRSILWNTVFDTKKHFYSDSFFVWSLFSIVTVFVVCSLIDKVREKLQKPIINWVIAKLSPLDRQIKSLFC